MSERERSLTTIPILASVSFAFGAGCGPAVESSAADVGSIVDHWRLTSLVDGGIRQDYPLVFSYGDCTYTISAELVIATPTDGELGMSYLYECIGQDDIEEVQSRHVGVESLGGNLFALTPAEYGSSPDGDPIEPYVWTCEMSSTQLVCDANDVDDVQFYFARD